MPDSKPDNRTVPAANADVLGEDTRTTGTMEGLSDEVGQDGTPRDRGQGNATESGEARPGKDENQAGFLKEKDKPGA